MVGGGLVEFTVEVEIPAFLIGVVLSWSELGFDGDGEVAVLLDDFFDVADEAVVGVELLFGESVLLEVAVQHLPEMLFPHFLLHAIKLLSTQLQKSHTTPL